MIPSVFNQSRVDLAKSKKYWLKHEIFILCCLSLLDTLYMKDYRNYVVNDLQENELCISLIEVRTSFEIWKLLDFFHHSHRIADTQEFRSNSIRMKIKKELAGRIRRGQTRGMTERDRKEDGRNLADRVTGARRKAI